MYCHSCGKYNPENSNFCRYCGTKFINISEEADNKKVATTTTQNKPKADLLWEKFVEIYDSEGSEKERFNSLSSAYVWELLERLAVNAFESFIQENKDELNRQPYKTIESLKNAYSWSVLGGYRLWLAEGILDDSEPLNKFKSFNLDKFIEEWKRYDFDKAIKHLSSELETCMSRYAEFRFKNLMENVPEAKNLSNATADKLKTSLLIQTLNGYHAGKIEKTFRKT